MDSIGAGEWFAVRVRPSFEQTVFEALTARGYEAFLPTYDQKNAATNRAKPGGLPLFSGYLFCRATLEQWLLILHTPGVRDVVTFGRTPVAVPDAEIEAVRRITQSNLRVEPHPYCSTGPLVSIKRGPLAGMEGVLVESCAGCKILVSVSLLRKAASAELDASWIRSAPESSCDERSAAASSNPEISNSETSNSEGTLAQLV